MYALIVVLGLKTTWHFTEEIDTQFKDVFKHPKVSTPKQKWSREKTDYVIWSQMFDRVVDFSIGILQGYVCKKLQKIWIGKILLGIPRAKIATLAKIWHIHFFSSQTTLGGLESCLNHTETFHTCFYYRKQLFEFLEKNILYTKFFLFFI